MYLRGNGVREVQGNSRPLASVNLNVLILSLLLAIKTPRLWNLELEPTACVLDCMPWKFETIDEDLDVQHLLALLRVSFGLVLFHRLYLFSECLSRILKS